MRQRLRSRVWSGRSGHAVARFAGSVGLALTIALHGGCGQPGPKPEPEPEPEPPAGPTVVSLVPAATEMLFAVGAGPQVVGVSSFDERPEAVASLPRVGALLDPDLERILALKPALVVTYGSQNALEGQLAQAGIATFTFAHGGLGDTMATLEALATRVGQDERGHRAANLMRARLSGVRQRVEGLARPRVLLVFGREPGALRQVWASGGTGFLHDLLDVAGAENVFADVASENVQASTEMLLTRAPEVIVELRREGAAGNIADSDAAAILEWSPLGSIPAVRDGRILRLAGDDFVIPGPRLADAAEQLGRALHPEAWTAAVREPGYSPTKTTSTREGTRPFS